MRFRSVCFVTCGRTVVIGDFCYDCLHFSRFFLSPTAFSNEGRKCVGRCLFGHAWNSNGPSGRIACEWAVPPPPLFGFTNYTVLPIPLKVSSPVVNIILCFCLGPWQHILAFQPWQRVPSAFEKESQFGIHWFLLFITDCSRRNPPLDGDCVG